MSDVVLGAVLAGGRGRRIGGEKTSLDLGGRTLLTRSVDVLRLVGLDVVLALRASQAVPPVPGQFQVLRDVAQDAGPLGGLHALLGWMPGEWVLVVPCDQPFMRPGLLIGLLAQPRNDVEAIVGRPADLAEPLPGLYRKSCFRAANEALGRGERSLRDFLGSLRLREVPGSLLHCWDPTLLSYINVNTPADVANARRLVATRALCYGWRPVLPP